jgi:hypothetical protein
MSRALIRSASAIAAAALLLAGSVLPAAASTAQAEIATIPASDQVTEMIPAPEFVTAMIGGLDQAVATAQAQDGRSVAMSGVGLLLFGPVLAAALYEYERQYSVAGS